MNTYLIPTTKARHLAAKIPKNKGLKVLLLDKNKDGKNVFPDGELYVRLSEINKIKGRVIILHSGAPEPNNGLVELEMILEVLKNNKNIKACEIFFSYFPYGRQNKIFQTGEANVTESLIKKFITYYKVKKIYIVDAHFSDRAWFKKYPLVSISAQGFLKQAALKKYPNLVFISPDAGSEERTGLAGAKKKRINSYEVKIACSARLDEIIKDKNVAVVDDIIETGGTLVCFHDQFLAKKAKKAVVLATHGVMSAGIKRIKVKYDQVYLTNSIDTPDANVDISRLIIKNIFNK
jgi:ribose-phosphate pyrophosphokinase